MERKAKKNGKAAAVDEDGQLVNVENLDEKKTRFFFGQTLNFVNRFPSL